MTERSSNRHDWLNLIEVSGPFLAVPVLDDVFPQGLEVLDTPRSQRLRRAHEEWREAVDAHDPNLVDLHGAWINEVLTAALEVDDSVLRRGDAIPDALRLTLPEHGVTLGPDVALVDPSDGAAPLLLVHVLSPDARLDATHRFDGLVASPAERMVALLRGAGCPVGLVTNGEHWMLVHAPVGRVASYTSWYARLWRQEPETLRAFVSLLGVRRFFGPEDEQLPTLYERSLKHQDDVTEALGEQVRRAIEVLVQAVDRADQDRNRVLLRDTEPRVLYEAALTVMMRLVFLLAAEERGLLLLSDERYDQNYALSTLRMQLRSDSEEILERRRSAWSRLLALFRAVYGGIEHPALRMPALGGSLFDPDRYPFLEGRTKGASWRTFPSEPLPVDDRTVLLLLEAIQTFEGRTLSYRALDVEQIGHVYEGLLERTVKRVDDVTLELEASGKAKEPRLTLSELESAALKGRERVEQLLAERSQRSASAIRNALDRAPDERSNARMLTVCRGDVRLRDRLLPYARLLRTDPWNYPLVHHAGAFVVVHGADRRETGTHYTPKSLTEKIVEETLTPLVYCGPAEGEPREAWALKRPDKLLELKVCDPAMGSGAFLVQACRFLSERLVEAWAREEAEGHRVDVEGRVRTAGEAFEPLSTEVEERAIVARRLVADRCLYGVDLNPLAVELAKLSLWLTTLAKGRPFGFLDHHLKSGDSLLGIHDLRQLIDLRMSPDGSRQLRLFGQSIARAVEEAVQLRRLIAGVSTRDIRDVEEMAALEAEARKKLRAATVVADAFIGIIFAGGSEREVELRLAALAAEADSVVRRDGATLSTLQRGASADVAVRSKLWRTFHWPLAFPEVFQRENGGFDGFVGNPPFLGGQRITGALGTAYRDWTVAHIADGRRGSADLVAYFFLRAFSLLRIGGHFGLLATNTIAEGDTRQVGLEAMLKSGAVIHAAYPNEQWPGTAAVVTSRIHARKGEWAGPRRIGTRLVTHISAFLSERDEWSAADISLNKSLAYQGSIVLGDGFLLTPDEAAELRSSDPLSGEVVLGYLSGNDLLSDPHQRHSRQVITFWDWPRERAEQYKAAFSRVEKLVKPERAKNKRRERRERWWQFAEKASALYHAVGRGDVFERHPRDWNPERRPLDRVLFHSFTSKYVCFDFVSNDLVFAGPHVVVASDDDKVFCALQSAIHEVWVRRNSSTMGTTLRYALSDCIYSFPFVLERMPPAVFSSISRRYREVRRSLCQRNQIGYTSVYNLMHSPDERDDQLNMLRETQRELDVAVAYAYGWHDLDLSHGFHAVSYLPQNDRVRFTVSERARVEVLRRLSELNREQAGINTAE